MADGADTDSADSGGGADTGNQDVPPLALPLLPAADVALERILLPPRRKVVADERELAAALASAQPGDDILLRGGRYRRQAHFITASGTPEAPIVLRSAPGEWAVLDGAGAGEDHAVLEVGDGGDRGVGAHWFIEQLEVTDSTETRGAERRAPVNLWGRGSSLRHVVVHDTGHVGNWRHTGANECHGLLVFNCGVGNNQHSMYVTGDPGGGRKRITSCVLLNASGHNLHAFHDTDPVGSLLVEGCVAAGAGEENLLLAVEEGNEHRMRDITLRRTYQWTARDGTAGVSLAEYGEREGHRELTLVDNVWQLGDPLDTTGFETVHGRGGELAVWPEVLADGVHYEPDPVEEGRGIVVVVNATARARRVTVDLGRLGIGAGDEYGVWDAADWHPEPLVGGRSLGTVPVPLRGDTRAPVGLDRPESTHPEFAVFIVRRHRRWVA